MEQQVSLKIRARHFNQIQGSQVLFLFNSYVLNTCEYLYSDFRYLEAMLMEFAEKSEFNGPGITVLFGNKRRKEEQLPKHSGD